MMKNIIEYIREDTCINCGSKRSVELYDINNNPVRYTILIDTDSLSKLKSKKLSHFQCRKCKKIYSLDWSNREYPIPLSDIKGNDFMREYNKK